MTSSDGGAAVSDGEAEEEVGKRDERNDSSIGPMGDGGVCGSAATVSCVWDVDKIWCVGGGSYK